jgi:hypothetical protein
VVINGAFDFWQRGTSVSGYTYTSDRWLAYNGAAVNTISRQSTSLNGFQYCARVQRNSGSTNTGATYLVQPVESNNSYQFQNKTTTLSFYARAGANFSASGSAINANIETSTGTDQSYIAAWAGSVSITSSKTLTTSWQLFTVTGLVPSTANQVAVNFNYTPVGTAGANDYFEVTGVQLEIGAAATPFARAGGSIGGELALCQRYYFRTAFSTAYAYAGNGQAVSTTVTSILINNPVPLRINAQTVDFSNLGITDAISIQSAITGLTLQQANNLTTAISTSGSSGLTQYRPYFLTNQNNVAGYIGIGAEL